MNGCGALPAEAVGVLGALRNGPGGLILMSHVRADADAWGSLFGLGHLLRDAGRRIQLVAGEDVPERYASLPGADGIVLPAAAPLPGDAPAVVVLDTATPGRLTPGGAALTAGRTVVRIDHHHATAPFGDPCWVDTSSPATAAMVLRLARAAGWRVSPAAADCLYAGILGDTGGFRYANTSVAALEAAAELAGYGARVDRLGFDVLDVRSRPAIELQRIALERARWTANGRIVASWLGPGDYEQTGARPEDLEGLVEFLRAVEGVRIAVLVDQPPGAECSHISWRTVELNAVPMARARGGGGHPGAAGADCVGTPDDILEEVIADAESALERIDPRVPATGP